MPTLSEIMDMNRSDKGTAIGDAHGYAPVYERWFEPIRNEPLRILEIGVCDPRMHQLLQPAIQRFLVGSATCRCRHTSSSSLPEPRSLFPSAILQMT